MAAKPKALVFFSYRNHKRGYIEMLFERLSGHVVKTGQPFELLRGALAELQIRIVSNELLVRESLTDRDLRDFHLLYFELWEKAPEQALAAALYAERHGIEFFSREPLQVLPFTKIGELAKLAGHGIPLPATFISSRRQIKRSFANNPPIAYPLIVKAANGFGGNNNFLVHSRAELCRVLDENRELQFVIQEYIPNECDYRCLIMGGRIVLVLKRARSADSGTHLNNTSKGAVGEVVSQDELPGAAREAALEAARLLNRDDFAGVDLMLHAKTGEPYVLEVNPAPQIEIGAAIDQKMGALVQFMQSRIEGKHA